MVPTLMHFTRHRVTSDGRAFKQLLRLKLLTFPERP